MTLEDPLTLVGTTVSDKYEIERVVGEGGFAIVYRATHRVWKRPVALKVFRALGDLPPDTARRGSSTAFIQEGRSSPISPNALRRSAKRVTSAC